MHIIVFGLVINNNDVISLFICSHSLPLNKEAYFKSLEEVVLLWIEKEASGRLYIWYRDCAIRHKQENPVLAVRKFLRPHHL